MYFIENVKSRTLQQYLCNTKLCNFCMRDLPLTFGEKCLLRYNLPFNFKENCLQMVKMPLPREAIASKSKRQILHKKSQSFCLFNAFS